MVVIKIQQLLQAFVEDRISPEELTELQELVRDEGNTSVIDEFMLQAYGDSNLIVNENQDKEQIFNEIRTRILEHPGKKKFSNSIMHPGWYRWLGAAAAILILAMVGGTFFYPPWQQRNEKKTEAASKQDIKAPESNRATITLANGAVMYLDSVGNGQLATEGNVRLVKLANGKIVYEILDPAVQASKIVQNTVSNPKASQAINITLSDGTRVWLNAESSITYPVLFTGTERTVTLKGEGYFEVTQVVDKKGTAQKFVVTAGNTQTEVLGTSFNISAYDDEAAVKVTLLEGRVDVGIGSDKLRLKPGQQASAQTGNLALNKNVNIDEVMAWKSDEFIFNETELKEVVRILSKWYNFDVVIDNNLPTTYIYANISKKKSLNEVLKILESSGLKFRIEKSGTSNLLIVFK